MEYEFLHNFSKPKQNPNTQLRQQYQKKKKNTTPSTPALTQNTDHLKNQNLPILLNDNSQYCLFWTLTILWVIVHVYMLS